MAAKAPLLGDVDPDVELPKLGNAAEPADRPDTGRNTVELLPPVRQEELLAGGWDTNPAYEAAVRRACVIIDDATYRRNFNQAFDELSLARYRLFTHRWTRRFVLLVVIVNLSLILFESPARPALALSKLVTYPIELFTLAVLLAQMAWIASFQADRASFFRSDRKHAGLVLVIVITLVDMLLSATVYSLRLSRMLRVYFVVYNSKFVRGAVRNIRRTIPGVLDVLVLMMIFTAAYAIICLVIFDNSPAGKEYFPSFIDSFITLFVLRTNSNFPEVMMPAYRQSSWNVIVFVVFLLIAMYLLTSLALAVVFNTFQEQLLGDEKVAFHLQRVKLLQAFELLDICRGGVITRAQFENLFTHLRPAWVPDKVHLVWRLCTSDQESDDARAGREMRSDARDLMSVSQFQRLPALLKYVYSEVHDETGAVAFDSSRALLERIRSLVRSKRFRQAVSLAIVINVVLIAWQASRPFDGHSGRDARSWTMRINLFFTAVYLVEAGLKLFAFGISGYFESSWNWFDFVLLVGNLVDLFVSLLNVPASPNLFRTLLVFRIFRLTTVLSSTERFGSLIRTIGDFVPALVTYAQVFFLVFYGFAIVGMELFGGCVYDGAPSISPTSAFAQADYFLNSMNDAIASFVTLFELTVGNDWHIIVQGYVAVTSRWAWLYFMAFNIFGSIIVINIVFAFMLDAFLLQFEINRTGKEKDARARIERITSSPMFVSRWRASPCRDMDYYLRSMFADELQLDGAT